MAQLIKAQVTFIMPKGDDRDGDTDIQIIVRKSNGNVIAQDFNVAPDQRFADPGTYGPFNIAVVDANASHADFQAGSSQLIIHPRGHDRWITDVVITLQWNDGSGLTCQSHTLIVDQDVNSATWPNSQTSLLTKSKRL
jgi:hypothetical protein